MPWQALKFIFCNLFVCRVCLVAEKVVLVAVAAVAMERCLWCLSVSLRFYIRFFRFISFRVSDAGIIRTMPTFRRPESSLPGFGKYEKYIVDEKYALKKKERIRLENRKKTKMKRDDADAEHGMHAWGLVIMSRPVIATFTYADITKTDFRLLPSSAVCCIKVLQLVTI